jgi:hypothetical protein
MVGYTNHSGGCPGADMFWETVGEEFGVKTIAYSFYNHVQQSKNPHILSIEELQEGLERVRIAAKVLRRPVDHQYPYIKNLLARNWFQVKNSEAVFAVGWLDSLTTVKGGTGWAVQMAVDIGRPVFVFDQKTNRWYEFNYDEHCFVAIDHIPTLTKNFAGIGSRDLTDDGIEAIINVYKHNYGEDV